MATPSIPMIVQGNTYSLALPLRIYIVDYNQLVLEDYTPDPTDEVVVKLQGKRRIYTYTPTIDGNIAKIALGGYELAGHYAVIVSIVKADGNRLKSHRYDQLVIVESLDELTQQELIEGVEEDVIYLSPQSFIAGKDGRGIVSIEKTATAGLVDTYTITYTDDTTSTFEVTNGRDGEDGQPGSPGQPGSDGVGIVTITKTATSGLVDTYTILLTNGNTTTFEVTNGKDGITPDVSNKADKAFVVTITQSGSGYTANKSAQEIATAVSAGRLVYATFSGLQYAYIANLGAGHLFQNIDENTDLVTWLIGDSVSRSVTPMQEELVFDNAPTENSNNPVKSGGIYTALDAKLGGIELADDANLYPIWQAYFGGGTISDQAAFNTACEYLLTKMYEWDNILFFITGTQVLRSFFEGFPMDSDRYVPSDSCSVYFEFITEHQGDTTYNVVGIERINGVWGWYSHNTTMPLQEQLVSGTNIKTINNGSLLGSGNLSLATAAELAGKADITTLVEVSATGDVSQALDSGKFYRFGTIDSLTLTFTAPSAGMGIYGGKFTASASWATLGIPESVDEAAGNDTIASGKTYEFNVLDDVIVIKEV